MFIRKNAPLIIGLCIPLLLIIVLAVTIYLPIILHKPQYSFLYVSGENVYAGNSTMQVQDGKLVKSAPYYYSGYESGYKSGSMPELYVYDVKSNRSTPIDFEQAKTLRLDPARVSPDGYEMKNLSSVSGVFFPYFWHDSDYGTYIVGHNSSRKLTIQSGSSQYYNSILFLGWIIP